MEKIMINDIGICKCFMNKMPTKLVGLARNNFQNKSIPLLVTYLNAHYYNLACKHREYKETLKKFDIIYADGYGVVVAARIFGQSLPGRLTAYDFFYHFCRLCKRKKLSLFLLGGEEEIAEKTAVVLKKKFPGLKIKGFHHGYFNKKEEKKVIAEINRTNPDFLLVNMGAPKQELWLSENIDKLNIKVGWCVGGLFNYISGKTPRCPYWIGKVGFEWLFRLMAEPRRLWKRYIWGLPVFGYNLLKLKLNDEKENN